MAQMLTLSIPEARRFLVRYHLALTDIKGVFDRLSTVQYDPLKPLGRNPDLVLQARVPAYCVDDWETYVYQERQAYDAWDKQACLVPMSDWPKRALIRANHRPWHDGAVLDEHPEAVRAALTAIDRRGPLSSLEFEDRERIGEQGSWLGPTRIKRILRALWARGELVTHHRQAGRHYYDRPARVIPHLYRDELEWDEKAYRRWILVRRHQAVGLLRPQAEAAIWSVCGNAAARAEAIRDLVETGDLAPVRVGEKSTLFHLPAAALPLLQAPTMEPRAVFLGPLDSLLWDRKTVQYLFDFHYIWEVYKPPANRRWGYYVLPVLYADRFVARFDSRFQGGIWNIARWWWEGEKPPTDEVVVAVRQAASRFMAYLGARMVALPKSSDEATLQVFADIVEKALLS